MPRDNNDNDNAERNQNTTGSDCNAISRDSGLPVSLNKIVRGRIENGLWLDEQVLWQGDKAFYGFLSDSAAGGRIAFDDQGRATSVEEKPKHPESNYAVTGLYFFDGRAPELARKITPSPRGELEITSLIAQYLDEGSLTVELMGRGYAWLDTGTHDSLVEAGEFVRAIEKRQGLKIGCPEEVAYRAGFINADQLSCLAEPMLKTEYGQYLMQLLEG